MGTIPPNRIGMNRRTFLQIIAVAGAAGSLRFFPWDPTDTAYHVVRKSQPMMGTVLNLIVCSRDRDQAEMAVTATTQRMLAIENKLSRFRNASEVAELNRTGTLARASDELLAVLDLADLIHKKSAGAFDITVLPLLDLYQQETHPLMVRQALLEERERLVGQQHLQIHGRQVKFSETGMGITLDGIGKGYIVDAGTTSLLNHGFEQVYVEAGGDLLVKGGKPHGAPWKIGIRNPRPQTTRELIIIEADNLAVATSGDYFQPFSPDFSLHHILNPRTGRSSKELASCTVTAPTTALADALATACMVLGGDDAVDLLGEFSDCEGYFVGKDLRIRKTRGFTG